MRTTLTILGLLCALGATATQAEDWFPSKFGADDTLGMRSRHLERNISVALVGAVLSAIVIGLGAGTAAIALALIGVMGFGIGLSGPSRDMLIRSATPPGCSGVFRGVLVVCECRECRRRPSDNPCDAGRRALGFSWSAACPKQSRPSHPESC